MWNKIDKDGEIAESINEEGVKKKVKKLLFFSWMGMGFGGLPPTSTGWLDVGPTNKK